MADRESDATLPPDAATERLLIFTFSVALLGVTLLVTDIKQIKLNGLISLLSLVSTRS